MSSHHFAYLSGRDYHCGLVGYQVKKQLRVSAAYQTPSNITVPAGTEHPHMLKQCFPVTVTEANETAHGRPKQFTLETRGKSREGTVFEHLFITLFNVLFL